MGEPKQWLPLGGRPLLLHNYDRLKAVCPDVVVLTNETHDEMYCHRAGIRTARDVFPGQGPLAGLHAGLQGMPASGIAVLLGCDLPFLRANVLSDMVTELQADFQLDAVVPYDGAERIVASPFSPLSPLDRPRDEALGHLYPVCAVYRGRVQEVAAACLRQQENALRRFLQKLHVLYIPTKRWGAYWPDPFFNMNTPADYQLACTLWKREGFDRHE